MNSDFSNNTFSKNPPPKYDDMDDDDAASSCSWDMLPETQKHCSMNGPPHKNPAREGWVANQVRLGSMKGLSHGSKEKDSPGSQDLNPHATSFTPTQLPVDYSHMVPVDYFDNGTNAPAADPQQQCYDYSLTPGAQPYGYEYPGIAHPYAPANFQPHWSYYGAVAQSKNKDMTTYNTSMIPVPQQHFNTGYPNAAGFTQSAPGDANSPSQPQPSYSDIFETSDPPAAVLNPVGDGFDDLRVIVSALLHPPPTYNDNMADKTVIGLPYVKQHTTPDLWSFGPQGKRQVISSDSGLALYGAQLGMPKKYMDWLMREETGNALFMEERVLDQARKTFGY